MLVIIILMEMIKLPQKPLVERLKEYVDDELSDSLYYDILSERAPDEEQKQLLLEFSRNEKDHAETFARAITMITGKKYVLPFVGRPAVPSDYHEALKKRVINESGDFRKYGNEYLEAKTPFLKDAFYKARTDENVHALRILYMLS